MNAIDDLRQALAALAGLDKVTARNGGEYTLKGRTEAGPAAANISEAKARRGESILPDDSAETTWIVTIPFPGAATLPVIMEEDRLYDDLGRRFVILAFEPSGVAAQILCTRLKE